jgi:hypothetical protein
MANMLNIEKVLKLGDWYGTRAEMLRERTQKQIAQRASADLGFPVTESNIQAIEGARGIRRHKGVNNKSGNDRLAVVAKIIEKLLVKLGEPVPDELQDIISHRATR